MSSSAAFAKGHDRTVATEGSATAPVAPIEVPSTTGTTSGASSRVQDTAPLQNTSIREISASPAADSRADNYADNYGGYGKPRGILGPVTLGPQVTGLGFPTLFRLGIEGKLANLVGFGVEYGWFPSMNISNVNTSFNSVQGSAKVYPLRGSFYLGVYLGSQSLSLNAVANSNSGSGVITATATAVYLTPSLGWKWVYESGFFLGLELGWQVVLNTVSALSYSQPTISAALQASSQGTQITNQLNILASNGLPSVALLQIGYLF
jgi:hypothetical protein